MSHPSAAPSPVGAEDLLELRTGSYDVVVGISGFGSYELSPDRWLPLYEVTGRTLFVLKYEAQTLPPVTKFTPPEVLRRWALAKTAARGAAVYLAGWVRRWLAAGRRVLLVGFSLGGYVAWEAARKVASPNLDVILMSAAIGDVDGMWDRARDVGSLVNLYSPRDQVLRRLYPIAVGPDETPAAGLGPLALDLPNIYNIDVSDLVGPEHSLGRPELVPRLARIGIGCLLGLDDCELPWMHLEMAQLFSPTITPMQAQRLAGWLVIDEELWRLYGEAESGSSSQAGQICAWADAWSLARPGRLKALLEVGLASVALSGPRSEKGLAMRSRLQLQGLLRAWLWQDEGVRIRDMGVHWPASDISGPLAAP
jgi:hypothetical protein